MFHLYHYLRFNPSGIISSSIGKVKKVTTSIIFINKRDWHHGEGFVDIVRTVSVEPMEVKQAPVQSQLPGACVHLTPLLPKPSFRRESGLPSNNKG